MTTTVASVVLLLTAFGLALYGAAIGNVAVMVAGLPCALACIVIVLWAEVQEAKR